MEAIGPVEIDPMVSSSGVIRALRAELQDKFRMAVAQNAVLPSWTDPRLGHCSDSIHGVVDPYFRQHGTAYKGKTLEIGDRCLALNPEKEGANNRIRTRCATFQPRFEKKCGLAKTEENEQNIVAMMKDDGSRKIQRCRTVRRIAEHRIGKDLLTKLNV